jgi:hypothetical protein
MKTILSATERIERIKQTKELREFLRELLDTRTGPMYVEEVLTAHREGPTIALAVLTNCRGRMTAEQLDSFFGGEFVQHLEAFRASLDSGAVSEDELKELWRALQDEQEEKH